MSAAVPDPSKQPLVAQIAALADEAAAYKKELQTSTDPTAYAPDTLAAVVNEANALLSFVDEANADVIRAADESEQKRVEAAWLAASIEARKRDLGG